MHGRNVDPSVEKWSASVRQTLGFLSQPIFELAHGIRFKTIPWISCLIPGLIGNFLVLIDMDKQIWKCTKTLWLYPTGNGSYAVYCFLIATSGFSLWAFLQVLLKHRMIKKLTEAFVVAGLKTPLGKFPSFVFDVPIDAMTRKLRLKRQFLSLKQFQEAKSTLESALQVYVDTFIEHRERGSVDIIYSHYPMEEIVTLGDSLPGQPRDTFIIGRSRSQEIKANLAKTPHFLVGGQTGGGKSTFLRQMITSLYVNNRGYQFRLIDLKGGLEFQIFEKLPRIKVMPDILTAIAFIKTVEKSHKYRIETLKLNGCKDLEAYYKKPKEKRLRVEGSYHESMTRMIIVIDEVADLFMANSELKTKDVQEAKRIIWKVAAQGRAIGLHLVVATQRPDVKALDSQIKTHLVGVVCFPMVNDASSMTVLGNGRATDLPRIPGRAIWKSDLDMIEVQTPFLKPEEAIDLMRSEKSKSPTAKGDEIETSLENVGNTASNVLVEVEGCDDLSSSDEVLSSREASKRSSEAPATSQKWVHPNFD